MKKILLGILFLSSGVIVSAEERSPILKWSEMEVQTINLNQEIIIRDNKVLRKGNYENGKFVEKSNDQIISEDDRKICTKKECVYINEDSMPIIELNNKVKKEGSWSFGPAKLKLERSMTNKK